MLKTVIRVNRGPISMSARQAKEGNHIVRESTSLWVSPDLPRRGYDLQPRVVASTTLGVVVEGFQPQRGCALKAVR